MKPGSGSPFSGSVPRGNPGLLRRPAPAWPPARTRAPDEFSATASGRLVGDDRSFGDFPVFDVAPKRHEQFARNRDVANPSQPATALAELALIPPGLRAGGLVADPTPRELHHDSTHVLVAGAGNALIVRGLPALIRGRHQAH